MYLIAFVSIALVPSPGGSEVTSDFIGPNDVKEADAVLQDFVLLKATLYVPFTFTFYSTWPVMLPDAVPSGLIVV